MNITSSFNLGVKQFSRGPWFGKRFLVEDDGLDWFYTFMDNDGDKCYLLSNNLPWEDREKLAHLYHTSARNNKIAWFAGSWLGFETVSRVQYFRKMALGWRFTSCIGLAFAYKNIMMQQSGQNYQPVVGAMLRKYSDSIKRDLNEIRDEKREYFYIDTSQYMSYKNEDLSDEFHTDHSPQPVSITLY